MFGAAITFLSTPVVQADSAQFRPSLGRSASASDDEADRTRESSISIRFAHNTLHNEAACRIGVSKQGIAYGLHPNLTHRGRVTRRRIIAPRCRRFS
jgi:hypothetical protein